MVERFAAPILLPESPGIPADSFVVIAHADGQASFVDPSAKWINFVGFSAEWQSPTLNRGDQRSDMTLSAVTLYYYAEREVDIEIDGSCNGGDTWPVNVTLTLKKSDSRVRQVSAFMHITGDDLRFRMRFPRWPIVKVVGYAPRLIDRATKVNLEALHA